MTDFLLGIASSLLATASLSAIAWYVHRRRLRRENGLGGVWTQVVYAGEDTKFAGHVERIDIVKTQENLRRSRVRGVIYRVYDGRLADGLQEFRSYRFRGHTSSGVECVHFWCVNGNGSNGVWLMVHNNRDEKQGEYLRRSTKTETALPLEQFPLRHVRPSSEKLREMLEGGSVDTSKMSEQSDWPHWAKDEFKKLRSLGKGTTSPQAKRSQASGSPTP